MNALSDVIERATHLVRTGGLTRRGLLDDGLVELHHVVLAVVRHVRSIDQVLVEVTRVEEGGRETLLEDVAVNMMLPCEYVRGVIQ